MQPVESIPPLSRQGIRKLIDHIVTLPPHNEDWSYSLPITGVEFLNENDAIVRLADGKDYLLSVVRFEDHVDDPMLIAMAKAASS